MALSRDVVIRLLGDASSATKAIKSAADAAEVSVGAYRRAEREQAKQARAAEVAAQKQRAAMESVGRASMIMGAVVAAGLALSAKAAIDWESAWAGVKKTVDGSPEQMNELEASLRNLATTLPATHEEIAGVAEAAGQLGIARGDIVEFTKVAIAMGVSTNLSAEDAAVGLARLSNIMGTSSGDVDRMGSSLVALGNAGASTEGEILDMSLRIAAAGRQAGMSEGEVMGLANAMSSLGIEAEAGGTAISTVIKKIGNAVDQGGKELESYAQIAGVSAERFATAWRDDAAGALVMVVDGLGRMQAEGQNVNTVINDLGLGGIRTSDTLLRLAGDADGLAESLATGNAAWAANSALMNEANQRYETTAARLQVARNQINDAAIDIGSFLLPALASGAEMVANFARGFQDLPGPLKTTVTVLGVLAATVGLVGGAAMVAVPKLAAMRTTMATMAASSGAATSAVGKFGTFMTGPWGAAIGVATMLLGGLITGLGASSRASESAADYQRDLASALRDSNGAIDENIRALAAQKAADEEIGESNLLEVAAKAGVSLPRLTDALLGNRDAYNEVRGALDAYAQANTTVMTDAEGYVTTSFNAQGQAAADAMASLGDLTGSMGGAVAENERLAAATKNSGGAAETATGSMDNLATSTGALAVSGEEAATAAERLVDALDELNGPTLDLRDATRQYQEALDDAAAAMGEEGWKKTLDETTEAGRANAEMLDEIAVAAMDQANAIAANGGSYDQFRNSLTTSREALVATAISMGATEEQAWALANQILQIPDAAAVDIELPTYQQVMGELQGVYGAVKGIPPDKTVNVGVLSEAAMQRLRDLGYTVKTLPDGTVEVSANTGAAENELAAFINRPRYITVTARVSTINQDQYLGGRAHGGPVGYARGGSPSASSLVMVGERGPELVKFGGSGYVTPADITANVLSSFRGIAAPSRFMAQAAAGPSALRGGTTIVQNHRTYAPNITVPAARPLTAREILDAARDDEWLHRG